MRLLFSLFLLAAIAGCRSDGSPPQPVEQTTETLGQAPADGLIELRTAGADEILDYVRQHPSRVKVVNFWATWCVPCREEFPDLVRAGQTFKDRGMEMIFVSADFPDQEADVIAFLKEQGVEGVTFLKKDGDDDAFISAFDPEWMGELPVTFVYDAEGDKRHAWLGPTTFDEVSQQVTPLLESR